MRNTLRHLGVDVPRLRGRWLILVHDCAVVPMARVAARAAQNTPTPCHDPVSEPEADEVKIISLGGSGAPKRPCLHVLKE